MWNSDTECDVCHEKTVQPYLEHALGRPDYLCVFCFKIVFNDGVVFEDLIRRESLRRRYQVVG